jgi:hypothetical protein
MKMAVLLLIFSYGAHASVISISDLSDDASIATGDGVSIPLGVLLQASESLDGEDVLFNWDQSAIGVVFPDGSVEWTLAYQDWPYLPPSASEIQSFPPDVIPEVVSTPEPSGIVGVVLVLLIGLLLFLPRNNGSRP